jgi:BirA family transcriptional regulator, biotin operon repressor / biotin---[acetyl-CoA-carboxylase] ligase
VFDEASVLGRIAATAFARLRYVHETASTNDDAARELGTDAARGTIFLSDYQSAGRGRRGRSWTAPAGSGLLFTVCLPDAIPASALWAVPFWCALAVHEACANVAGVDLRLQWPNDLLLDARKVCGILSVSRVAGDSAWVACGIGLNVQRPRDDGNTVDPGAAYLSDADPAVRREDLFVAIVQGLDASLALVRDPQAVARAWEHRARLAGTPYRIAVDGEPAPFDATARRLDATGRLVVTTADGNERTVSLGDARVLRD